MIDVEGELDADLIKQLTQRLEAKFYPAIEWNLNFPINLSGVETFGDKQYDVEQLMFRYVQQRPLSTRRHLILLIQGETFSPAGQRNYSRTYHNFQEGSVSVISLSVLRLPPYTTKDFAQRRFGERLYKSLVKRLISMYGYQPSEPDCLLRFFRSIEFMDELPDDVCPSDRTTLEQYHVIKPL